jgi:DNA-binding SARP family transcriptional activator
MPELKLRLLGGVQFFKDEVPIIGFASAKAQALLCYLAVTERAHTRETLATLFWGDLPEESAKNNLRRTLSNLTKLLGEHLTVTRQTIAFNRESAYALDVVVFQSEMATLHAQLNEKEHIQTLQRALALYQGDFLAGFHVSDALAFEEWQSLERERLRQMALRGFHSLAAYFGTRGQFAQAIEYTTKLLQIEPWREEAHRQLIELYMHSGQRSAALAQYETCQKLLREHMGVAPSAEISALYEQLKATPPTPPHNLPIATSSFVGRAEELAEVKRLLTMTRLLTLTGPGGAGKTRLALQVAGELLSFYVHGVWFIDLSRVASPALVDQTVAVALGVRESPKKILLEALTDELRHKRLLLVLDNCEHLLDACANLAEHLLSKCGAVKILATSREFLNIFGETL